MKMQELSYYPKESGLYWARKRIDGSITLDGAPMQERLAWKIVGVSLVHDGSIYVQKIGDEEQYDFTDFRWGDKIEVPLP